MSGRIAKGETENVNEVYEKNILPKNPAPDESDLIDNLGNAD